MSPDIQMSAADLNEADVQAVIEVVRSGRLALGPKAEEFEQMLADYVGVRHAVAVNSGTAALHLIVKALEIGPGDEVLVPSFTFAASVNAILYEGATPVFVDIDPDTYNLCAKDAERKVTPRTRAIMAVDVFGHPVEWDDLLSLAGKHGLHIIDDSCEALGAEYRGRRIGAMGDAAAFAFYPNKQITTGEGGILVTDDDEIARTARSLRNQGRGEMGAWLEHERLGFNYRMDEMSAALGVSQLRRIEGILDRRAGVAGLYDEFLQDFPLVRRPQARSHVTVSWFVYVITLAEGLDRDEVMTVMEHRGIPVRGYFPPVHLQPYILESTGSGSAELPVTESIAKRTMALPFHGNMEVAEVERVVKNLARSVAEVRV